VGSTLYADRGPPFGLAEFYGNTAGGTNFLMAHGDTTSEPLTALEVTGTMHVTSSTGLSGSPPTIDTVVWRRIAYW
jgi:hypothetical protein